MTLLAFWQFPPLSYCYTVNAEYCINLSPHRDKELMLFKVSADLLLAFQSTFYQSDFCFTSLHIR